MIGSWNVRGCNDPTKIREIRNFIIVRKLYLICILDSKVRALNEEKCQRKLMQQWRFYSHNVKNSTGRLWIGWDPSRCNVEILHSSNHWIHGNVHVIQQNSRFLLTFVYGVTDLYTRRELWDFLVSTAPSASTYPWCVLGDFNAIRHPSEHGGGRIVWKVEDNEFNEACHAAGLEELNTVGCHFTWTNRRVRDPILSRLDRVLVSSCWF